MSKQVTIFDLDTYIQIISKRIRNCSNKNIKISSNTYRLFFRGQSKLDWSLEPSINRLSKDESAQINKYYDEYGNISLFQNLSLQQHQESGTRFLDFTKNPLVALYFACNEHKESDGKVFVLFFDGLHSNWNKAKMLFYFTEMPLEKDEIMVNEYKKYLLENHYEFNDYTFDLNADIINSILYGNIILPLKNDYYINKRLSRQCGVFFICPPNILHIGKREMEHIKNGCIWSSDNEVIFSRTKVQSPKWLKRSSIEEIIIDNRAKQIILNDLDKKFGINKNYLFP